MLCKLQLGISFRDPGLSSSSLYAPIPQTSRCLEIAKVPRERYPPTKFTSGFAKPSECFKTLRVAQLKDFVQGSGPYMTDANSVHSGGATQFEFSFLTHFSSTLGYLLPEYRRGFRVLCCSKVQAPDRHHPYLRWTPHPVVVAT